MELRVSGWDDDRRRQELRARALRLSAAASKILTDSAPRSVTSMLAGREVRNLAEVAKLRADRVIEALDGGEDFKAASTLVYAIDALGMAAQLREHEELAPDARRGRPFSESPNRPKRDGLGKLIVSAFEELGPRASANAVFRKAQEIDLRREPQWRLIAGVDPDETLFWRHKGGLKETDRPTFNNRVSRVRKKIRQGKITLNEYV